MISFKLAPHQSRPDVQSVEVYEGATLVATITPGDDPAQIRVWSKFYDPQRPPNLWINPALTSDDNRPIGFAGITFYLPPPGARRPGYN